jgi:archaellum component FlaC
MPDFVTREEFEARVGVLEQEVDGEKLVTRHILEQTRRNGDDIAAMKTQLGRIETRLDGVETQLGGVQKELGGVQKEVGGIQKELGGMQSQFRGLNGTVQSLVKNLPKIVGEAMREVLNERRGKT